MPGRPLIYIITIDGRLVLRISEGGRVTDHPLTPEQARLMLHELAKWNLR